MSHRRTVSALKYLRWGAFDSVTSFVMLLCSAKMVPPLQLLISLQGNFKWRVSCQSEISFIGPSPPHTWLLPFVSRPSVDKEEDGRGLGPIGVAGCGWLTCEAISSDSQRSSSSLTSLSICSLWASVSRPTRSSWQTKTDWRNLAVGIKYLMR